MAGLNKIQIIGNLGRDPEMRFTPQGTAVTSFSVAVTRRWGGGEDGKNEETIWFRVSAWNRLAEICNEYLSKGKQVYIEGRIRQPQIFTDRNGAVRASLEMTATDMVMLGSRGDSDYTSPYGDDHDDTTGDEPSTPSREGKDTPAPRNKPQPITSDENDDEIPF